MKRVSFASRRVFAMVLLAGASLTTSVCSAEDPAAIDRDESGYTDVLFIGNSLTYSNDLPAVVETISRLMQDASPVRAAIVAEGNFNLEDHWALGTAVAAIDEGGWEYVVLQQGPSSVEANRQNLITWTREFADRAARVGAQPALYAAWPQEDRLADFPRAIESYRQAAAAVDGTLLPVSTAWHIVRTQNADVQLYSDGLHPSGAGTYLTAAVIYGAMRGVPVASLPNEIITARLRITLPPSVGAVLRAAADSANNARQ